jgi:Arc/MetJ family transcription regulator
MRTNILLDDLLVAEAMKLAGASTKREVVHLALLEMVQRRRQRDVLALAGKGLIAPDYDVRAARAAMPGRRRGAG